MLNNLNNYQPKYSALGDGRRSTEATIPMNDGSDLRSVDSFGRRRKTLAHLPSQDHKEPTDRSPDVPFAIDLSPIIEDMAIFAPMSSSASRNLNRATSADTSSDTTIGSAIHFA
ncbi:hypothetical protein BD626DRAFT_566934 [Schizophyllum amplum]|uniref:Uncharacterized protein n=1 Tax=Schizophyllum amplum TaxID=97359 RepID=A0A550CNK9_9AGAR|nr:hypothetical protein BD626DRAFT_566934 [Auriculariopsis ampla]